MNRAKNLFFTLALIALALYAITRPAEATPSFSTAAQWNAVTTFESIGLYWTPGGISATQTATVRFREQGTTAWRDGLDLWFDARNTEYRGSLVELKPNTPYEIQLKLGTGAWSSSPASCDTGANECVLPVTGACTSANQTQCTRTWSDDFTPAAGYLVNVPASIRRIDINGATGTTTPTFSTANGVMTVTVSNAADPASYAVIQGANYPASRMLVQGVDGNGENCVNINGASHVVIRGLDLASCARTAISMNDNNHHIVIDDNEMRGWGGWGHDGNGTLSHHPDGDGAIQCRNPANRSVNQVVIQRNLIHDARWSATYWGQSQILQPDNTTAAAQNGSPFHPTGPSATNFEKCGNNHVIRYNDFFATESNPSLKYYEYPEQGIKYFQDAVTGAENKTTFGNTPDPGFPWADSDIYGNHISHTHDDGIESEGFNRNVRIWKNYTNKVLVNIANSWVTQGPLYVWRNVSDVQARMTVPTSNPDDTNTIAADRGPFIKAGDGGNTIGAGRSYYFHNTALQAPPSTCGAVTFPCGAGSAIRRDEDFWNTYSKNNIWQDGWHENIFDLFCGDHEADPNVRCSIDFDMFNGTAPLGDRAVSFPSETHGFANTKPTYAVGTNFPTGGYPTTRPTATSPTGNFQITGTGANAGVAIPNFNDQYSTRDVGAQSGADTMTFGRAAAPTPPPSGPSVTIDQASGQVDPSSASTLNFTAVFSENVTGFANTDVTVTGTAGGTKTVVISGGPSTYNVAVSGMTTSGTVIVSIPAGAAQNGAGASNSASTSTDNNVTFSAPTGAPTVTINQAAGQADPGSASPINFTAVFSEAVTGFTSSDVAVSGTAGGTKTVTVSGGPSTYNVAVSGMTTAGTVVVSIPAGAAQNGAGTASAASTSTDNQVTFSTTPSGTYELFVSVNPGLTVNRTAGERFDFSVEAADARALTSVKFYIDNVLQATDTTAPFQYSWTTAAGDALGSHALRVEATDAQGSVAIEARNLILLADNCGGLLSATSVVQGTPLTVQGVCSSYKTVTEMEFSADGELRGSDVSSSYFWTLDTSALPVGSHTVAINGKFSPSGSTSATTTFDVTAPALAVTLSPGSVILPDETITFSAAFTDGRPVRQIDFLVDGAFKAGTIAPPYQFPWTPGNVASSYGRHTLLVQATDTNGNVVTVTRDLLVQPRSCSLLLGLSRYIVGNNDTVYVMPHRVAQGQPVTVQSTCSSTMTVSQVEFYLDGALVSTDTTAPYTWTLGTSGLALGTHTLATKGRLAGGAETNDSVTIEIVAP